MALPDPPVGVFDAAAYQRYRPARGSFADPSSAKRIPAEPRAILVVGLTAVGDVLHFLPVAFALRRRFPQALIGWAVQDKARAVVEGQPCIDRVHVFERHRWSSGLLSPRLVVPTLNEILAFRRQIAGVGYEVLFDPQGTAKTAMINALSGVPVRVGFGPGLANELNHLSTNVHVELATKYLHRSRRALALMEAMGVEAEGIGASYRVPGPAQIEADRELASRGLDGKRLLVMHPGTSALGAGKRWPIERFMEVARQAASGLKLDPLFVIGPVERNWRPAMEASARAAGIGSVPILEPSGIAQLGGLLGRAACFLGSDSGPLHLASSMGVPCVGLYGPTDPVFNCPLNPPAVVVVKGLMCPKCRKRFCKHEVPRMESIEAAEALTGLERLLKLTASGQS